LKVRLSDIPLEGLELTGDEEVEYSFPPALGETAFEGPMRYKLKVFLVSGELIVRGHLASKLTFTCSRCAKRFSKSIEDNDFNIALNIEDLRAKGVSGQTDTGRKRVRKRQEDPESVDLTDYTREAIILTLPNYPVCREDCKGLCGRCGADLNEGECGCSPEPGIGWEVLDGLKLK